MRALCKNEHYQFPLFMVYSHVHICSSVVCEASRLLTLVLRDADGLKTASDGGDAMARQRGDGHASPIRSLSALPSTSDVEARPCLTESTSSSDGDSSVELTSMAMRTLSTGMMDNQKGAEGAREELDALVVGMSNIGEYSVRFFMLGWHTG